MLAERYPQFEIGFGSYGNIKINQFGEETKLSIGKYCSLADGVQIMLGGGHQTEWVTTYPFSALDDQHKSISGHPVSKGDVVIGNDVWIGREAMILSGVTIGNGAVVGARALVARDVAPYAIVVGNPARIVRQRFSDVQISALERIAWWDWPRSRIDVAMSLLLADDIDAFIDAVVRGEL
jgi:acetyltransferase-like isoleucine patch superfamily enzyme